MTDDMKPVRALAGAVILTLLAACAATPPLPATDPEPVVERADPDTTDFSAEEELLATDDEHGDGFAELGIASEPVIHEDLWDRIRVGMTLPEADHAQIRTAREWYARHQDYLDRVTTRARPYLHLIVEEVERREMPLEIALLPIVESAFDPYAYSHGRASGLWQFIPDTGRRYGLKQNWWYDGRRDVVEATRAALDYLEFLHAEFDGDWLLALAAYNSGEHRVARAVRQNREEGKPTDFFSLRLPRETRGYAPKLLALRDLVRDPAAYDITLQPVANTEYLAVVELEGQIDLALAARLADISVNELYLLNPGYNRWATDPAGPHALVLPLDRVELFENALAQVPKEERVSWGEHRVLHGDTLSVLARRHRTTVGELQRLNGLDGSMIRTGQTLLVPTASRPVSDYTLTEDNRVATTQATDRGGERMEYTVRRGDSLWRIGRQHGIGVRNLASWNSMAPTDVLREGQTLVIWLPTRSGALPSTHAGPSPENTVRAITYTVRRGDSLARISQRFRVSVNQLTRWNSIDPEKYLQPGQRLRVWVDVTAQSGG